MHGSRQHRTRAEADKEGVGLYNKVYDNLVAKEKDLNTRQEVGYPHWIEHASLGIPSIFYPPLACLPHPAALQRLLPLERLPRP